MHTLAHAPVSVTPKPQSCQQNLRSGRERLSYFSSPTDCHAAIEYVWYLLCNAVDLPCRVENRLKRLLCVLGDSPHGEFVFRSSASLAAVAERRETHAATVRALRDGRREIHEWQQSNGILFVDMESGKWKSYSASFANLIGRTLEEAAIRLRTDKRLFQKLNTAKAKKERRELDAEIVQFMLANLHRVPIEAKPEPDSGSSGSSESSKPVTLSSAEYLKREQSAIASRELNALRGAFERGGREAADRFIRERFEAVRKLERDFTFERARAEAPDDPPEAPDSAYWRDGFPLDLPLEGDALEGAAPPLPSSVIRDDMKRSGLESSGAASEAPDVAFFDPENATDSSFFSRKSFADNTGIFDFTTSKHAVIAPQKSIPASQPESVSMLQNVAEWTARGTSPETDARAVLTACQSVRKPASRYGVVFTRPDETKESNEEGLTFAEIVDRVPELLARREQKGLNLITRVRYADEFNLIQLDEVNALTLEKLANVTFATFQTSPHNGQAWIALPADTSHAVYESTIQRLIAKLKPDCPKINRGASGSMRLCGSRNMKPEHGGCPVFLLSRSLGRIVTVAELDSLGLLAAPDTVRPTPARKPAPAALCASNGDSDAETGNFCDKYYRDYYRSLIESPDFEKEKRSGSDMSLAHKLHANGETFAFAVSQVEKLSTKAAERSDNYAVKTVSKAYS